MISRKTFTSITLFLFFWCITFSQENAEGIFKKATDRLLITNMELSIEIKTTDKSGHVKEKAFVVLRANYGENEKTKMTIQKPERAKGITIVFTENPKGIGEIEILTPANGKVRKLKATPENMNMVGSDFSMDFYTNLKLEELSLKLLGEETMDAKNCFKIEVKEKNSTGKSKAELLIEKESYNILQILQFDESGDQLSLTTLSDFHSILGSDGKIQAMQLKAEDYKTMKSSEMRILKVEPRKNIPIDEFKL